MFKKTLRFTMIVLTTVAMLTGTAGAYLSPLNPAVSGAGPDATHMPPSYGTVVDDPNFIIGPGSVPDYLTTPNWAYSPPLTKFVDQARLDAEKAAFLVEHRLDAGGADVAGQGAHLGHPAVQTGRLAPAVCVGPVHIRNSHPVEGVQRVCTLRPWLDRHRRRPDPAPHPGHPALGHHRGAPQRAARRGAVRLPGRAPGACRVGPVRMHATGARRRRRRRPALSSERGTSPRYRSCRRQPAARSRGRTQPARRHLGKQPLADAHGHVLVKAVVVAEGTQEQLQALRGRRGGGRGRRRGTPRCPI